MSSKYTPVDDKKEYLPYIVSIENIINYVFKVARW